jgi:hypothetical protein
VAAKPLLRSKSFASSFSYFLQVAVKPHDLHSPSEKQSIASALDGWWVFFDVAQQFVGCNRFHWGT